jgi:hypothetical protein
MYTGDSSSLSAFCTSAVKAEGTLDKSLPIYMNMCMCVFMHTYILLYVCMYVNTYIYIQTNIHKYMHIYIYIHTYIHTHILLFLFIVGISSLLFKEDTSIFVFAFIGLLFKISVFPIGLFCIQDK